MDKPRSLTKEELRTHRVVYGRPEFVPDDGPVPDDQLLSGEPAYGVIYCPEQVYLLPLRLHKAKVSWSDSLSQEEWITVGHPATENTEVYATPQEALLAELLADLAYYQKGLEYTRTLLERVQKLR